MLVKYHLLFELDVYNDTQSAYIKFKLHINLSANKNGTFTKNIDTEIGVYSDIDYDLMCMIYGDVREKYVRFDISDEFAEFFIGYIWKKKYSVKMLFFMFYDKLIK